MSAPRLVIIADDLTGAQDTAAPFAARGAKVWVALNAESVADALAQSPDILAVSTNSRELSEREATKRVAAVLAALPSGARLFKKIDSRLKGNVVAELSAISFDHALVAPAIPAFGRIVRDGNLQGFGVDAPINVAAILGNLANRTEIPDSITASDMEAALAETKADLLIGARGLGEALAAKLYPAEPTLINNLPGPRVLVVVGSHDPITLKQVAEVETSHAATVVSAPSGQPAAPLDGEKMLVVAKDGAAAVPGAIVEKSMAEAVAAAPRPDTLVLTGGATASAVLDRFSVGHIELLGECLPGLPVSRRGNTTFVLKSGGFGTAETLTKLFGMVGRNSPNSAKL